MFLEKPEFTNNAAKYRHTNNIETKEPPRAFRFLVEKAINKKQAF